MGFLDKFVKKKDRPQSDEVSPGGSEIYRYAEPENMGLHMPERYGQYAEEVNAHFAALFPGRNTFVFHELVSDYVHLDVNIMEPTEDEPYYVLYTTGMSDEPMTLPEELSEHRELLYAELFWFLPSSWNPGKPGQAGTEMPESEYWPIRLLKFLARFPHTYHTWLAYGHTVPNGPEYAPLCEETKLGGVAITQFTGDMGGFTAADGEKMNLLMPIPAYREEIEFKLQYGMEELDKRFNEGGLPMVIDPQRRNFCEDFLGTAE